MTVFHPPSLIEAIVALNGEVAAATIVDAMAGRIGRHLIETWRCGPDGEAMRWPPERGQLARLGAHGTPPSGIYLDGPAGGMDLHRFNDPGFFPQFAVPPLPAWRLSWTSRDLSEDADPSRLRVARDAAVSLVRDMAAGDLGLHAALVARTASCFAPTPPQALPSALLYLCDAAKLGEQYQDSQVYWRAWDVRWPLADGRFLVARGLDIDDEAEFKRAVYPRTWDLARHARPGLTIYPSPEVAPWERALFDAGEPTLTALGYDAGSACLEYTAYVGEHEHVLPREIFALRGLLAAGHLQDGRRLSRIRVSFPDRAMAMREVVPLADSGIEVLCLAGDGSWQSVTLGG